MYVIERFSNNSSTSIIEGESIALMIWNYRENENFRKTYQFHWRTSLPSNVN